MTQDTLSNASSSQFTALRDGSGNWVFSAVTSAAFNGATVTPSGSGTTLTLSFSRNNQFGLALVQIITQS
jgi:hypothetical protein